MVRRFPLIALFLLGIRFWGVSFALAGDDFLKLVPESASAIVVVNHPADLDDKLQKLGNEMKLPIPGLSAMIKQHYKIEESWNGDKPLTLIALPSEDEDTLPMLFLALPVDDYDKFLRQFKPDKTAEKVARIEFSDNVYVVRNIGKFAVLTLEANEEALKETFKYSPEIFPELASWKEWLAGRDIAGILFQPGIHRTSARAQKGLNALREIMGALAQSEDPKMAKTKEHLKAAMGIFDLYAKGLQAAVKEVSAIGIGLQFDEQRNLSITTRIKMNAAGSWIKTVAGMASAKAPLPRGLLQEPYVAAGGITLPEPLWNSLLSGSLKLKAPMFSAYGLNEEQIQKISEVWGQAFPGIQSISLVLQEGKKDAPLLSNLAAVMRVDDSAKYMERYEKAIEQTIAVSKENADTPLPFLESEKVSIDGVSALQITTAIPAPASEAGKAAWKRQRKIIFGSEAKISVWIAPADERHVAIAYIEKEHLSKMIETIRQGKLNTAIEGDAAQIAAKLPADPMAAAYINPSNLLQVIGRMAPGFTPAESGIKLNLPEFPETPPIGFAAITDDDELQTCTVVSVEILKAIVPYIQQVQAVRGEADSN